MTLTHRPIQPQTVSRKTALRPTVSSQQPQAAPLRTKPLLREGRSRLSFLIENELEKAELVLAVKAITDKLQDMAEDLAKIEADDIMPMLDSLKTAFGPQIAEQFSKTSTEQVRQLVSAIGAAKNAIGDQVMRLEQAVNGGASNDMAMDTQGDPQGDPAGGLGDDSGGLDAGDPGGDPLADTGAADAGGGDPLAGGGGDPLGDRGGGDPLADAGDDAAPMPKMSAAGRARKESAARGGRRLVEFAGVDFNANLNNLATFDPRAGALGHSIHDMIDTARFDGAERGALTNVLGHLASCAADLRHWEDPDAKVDTALRAAHIDVRLPEARAIISKLKKLAHLISLKHDGMMESRRRARAISTLREAKNPDAVVLRSFRRALAETRNAGRAVQQVAARFAIEPGDVIAIVREAKQLAEGRRRPCHTGGHKPAMRMPTPRTPRSRKPTPQRSMREAGGDAPWRDIVEGDTRRMNEQQPMQPKSPADMRADRAAMAAQQQAQADGNGTPAPRQATQQQPAQQQVAQERSAQQRSAQRNPSQNTPQNSQGMAQAGIPQQRVPTSVPPGQKPVATQQQPMQPGANGQAGANQMTQQATPPGQSPQKAQAAPNPPDMPGKVVNQVPDSADAAAITLMSKPTPFPKPGPPLMGTAPQAAPVGEGRLASRNKPGLLKANVASAALSRQALAKPQPGRATIAQVSRNQTQPLQGKPRQQAYPTNRVPTSHTARTR